MNTTLPTDSKARKNYALFRGCLRYFPAALAGVAKTSKLGNDKHNPGKEEMFHDRDKSQDHGDCILRHLIDLEDLLVAMDRGESVDKDAILIEASSMAWRALALSQQLHERFGAPMAPGAKTNTKQQTSLSVVSDAIALHNAAEEAQQKVKEMVEANKKQIFQKPPPKFDRGDIVKHIDNDVEMTVEGTFYDAEGKAILFIRDSNNQLFGVDPTFYKGMYK